MANIMDELTGMTDDELSRMAGYDGAGQPAVGDEAGQAANAAPMERVAPIDRRKASSEWDSLYGQGMAKPNYMKTLAERPLSEWTDEELQSEMDRLSAAEGVKPLRPMPTQQAERMFARRAKAIGNAERFDESPTAEALKAGVKSAGRALYNMPAEWAEQFGEDNPLTVGVSGANDVANAITAGVAKIPSGLEKMMGVALGGRDTKVGSYLIDDAQGYERAVDRALPQDTASENAGYDMGMAKMPKDIAATITKFTLAAQLGPAGLATQVASDSSEAYVDTYDRAIARGASPDEARSLATSSFAWNAIWETALTSSGLGKAGWKPGDELLAKNAAKAGGPALDLTKARKPTFTDVTGHLSLGASGKSAYGQVAAKAAGRAAKDAAIMGLDAAGKELQRQDADGESRDWDKVWEAGGAGGVEGGAFGLAFGGNAAIAEVARLRAKHSHMKRMFGETMRHAYDSPEFRRKMADMNPEATYDFLKAYVDGGMPDKGMVDRMILPPTLSGAERAKIAEAFLKDGITPEYIRARKWAKNRVDPNGPRRLNGAESGGAESGEAPRRNPPAPPSRPPALSGPDSPALSGDVREANDVRHDNAPKPRPRPALPDYDHAQEETRTGEPESLGEGEELVGNERDPMPPDAREAQRLAQSGEKGATGQPPAEPIQPQADSGVPAVGKSEIAESHADAAPAEVAAEAAPAKTAGNRLRRADVKPPVSDGASAENPSAYGTERGRPAKADAGAKTLTHPAPAADGKSPEDMAGELAGFFRRRTQAIRNAKASKDADDATLISDEEMALRKAVRSSPAAMRIFNERYGGDYAEMMNAIHEGAGISNRLREAEEKAYKASPEYLEGQLAEADRRFGHLRLPSGGLKTVREMIDDGWRLEKGGGGAVKRWRLAKDENGYFNLADKKTKARFGREESYREAIGLMLDYQRRLQERETQGPGAETQANGAGQGTVAETAAPPQGARTEEAPAQAPKKPVPERTVVEKMTEEAPPSEPKDVGGDVATKPAEEVKTAATADRLSNGKASDGAPEKVAETRHVPLGSAAPSASAAKPGNRLRRADAMPTKKVKSSAKAAAKVVGEFVMPEKRAKSHPSLAKPWHDKKAGMVVATDGRALIATRHGFDPDFTPSPEATYPKWQEVIPSESALEHSVDIDPEAVAKMCREMQSLSRATGGKGDNVFVYLPLDNGTDAVISANVMAKVAKAMSANGITRVRAQNAVSPFVAANDDTTVAFMPMRKDDIIQRTEERATGRTGDSFYFDGATGRLVSAPAEGRGVDYLPYKRLELDGLRTQYADFRARKIDDARHNSVYKTARKAHADGKTDAAEIYSGWNRLNPEERELLVRMLNAETDDAAAEALGEYLMGQGRDRTFRDSLLNKIGKLERLIAAEDRLDALLRGENADAERAKAAATQSAPNGNRLRRAKTQGVAGGNGPARVSPSAEKSQAAERKPKAQEPAERPSMAAPQKTETTTPTDAAKPMEGAETADAAERDSARRDAPDVKSEADIAADGIVSAMAEAEAAEAELERRIRDKKGVKDARERLARAEARRDALTLAADGGTVDALSARARRLQERIAERVKETQGREYREGGGAAAEDSALATLWDEWKRTERARALVDGAVRRGTEASAWESLGEYEEFAAKVRPEDVEALTDLDVDAALRLSPAGGGRGALPMAWDAKAKESLAGFADRLSNFMGLEVEFADRPADGLPGANAWAQFDRKTGVITLFPGARPSDVVHEMTHGLRLFAEMEARAGRPELLGKLNEIAGSMPEAAKMKIAEMHADGKTGAPLSGDALLDELLAHELGGMADDAFGRILRTLEGRAWYSRAWQAAKDLWRAMLRALGFDRAKLDGFMRMKPKDAARWIVEQMAKGRRFGRLDGLGKGARNREGGEMRHSAAPKEYAAEDAESRAVRDRWHKADGTPKQIKSATDNTGAFDAGNPDIRRSPATPAHGAIAVEHGAAVIDREMSTMERQRALWQDHDIPIRNLQRDIGGVREVIRPSDGYTDWRRSTDLYEAKDKAFGREEYEMRRLQHRVDEVNRILANDGVAPELFDRYLMALHTRERNWTVQMRELGEYSEDNPLGTGMSAEEAKDFMLSPDVRAHSKALGEAAERLYEINRADLRRRHAAGRLSDEELATYLNDRTVVTPDGRKVKTPAWKHYVPLKTDIDNPALDSYSPSTAKMKPREFMKAHGRGKGDLADSPFAMSVLQAEQGIKGSVANEVANVAANLVLHARANGHGIGEIVEGRRLTDGEHTFSFADGDRVKAIGGMRLADARDDIQLFKRGGKLYAIRWEKGENGRGLAVARAAQDLDLMKPARIAPLTRLYSALRTQYNPVFVATNMVADATEAGNAVLGRFGIRDAADFGKEVAKVTRRNASDLVKFLRTGEAEGYVREWAEAGGMIRGGVSAHGFAATDSSIRSNYRKFARDAKGLGGRNPVDQALALKDFAVDGVTLANEFAENLTRVNLYAGCRRKGMPPNEAVKFSRDATVNFNRKGSVMPYVNSYYAFGNAAVQGSVRAMQAMGDRYGHHDLLATVALAVASCTWNHFMGNDDGREREGGPNARNLSEYRKAQGPQIAVGTVTVAPVRLRGPFSAVFYAAYKGMEVLYGDAEPGEAAAEVAAVIGDSASMFLGDGSIMDDGGSVSGAMLLQKVSPSILDPFVQGLANADYMGRKIYDEPRDRNVVRSAGGRIGTGAGYKAAAKGLNRLTGGSDARRGIIDVPPEVIRHVAESLLGGIGVNAGKAARAVDAVREGDWEKAASTLPFLDSFVRPMPDVSGRYGKAVSEYERDKAEYRGTDDRDVRNRLRRERPSGALTMEGKSIADRGIDRVRDMKRRERGMVKKDGRWVEASEGERLEGAKLRRQKKERRKAQANLLHGSLRKTGG